MPKEIYPSSYECDCGHQLHFCESTIREIRQVSHRKRTVISEGADQHAVIFHKGNVVAIYCPRHKEEMPIQRLE